MNRPVSKTMLIILLVVVLAAIGFFVYNHRAAKVPVQQVPENTSTPTASQQWSSARVSDQTVNQSASYYTISATYPVTKDPVANAYFKTYVDNAISEFKSDTSWAASSSTDEADAGQLSLNITYVEQKNDVADNYIFTDASYEGGAHGLSATQTYSFSPDGQLIALSDLFTNGDTGLNTIAPYVKAQLMNTIPSTDQQFIADGTAPTEDNYGTFTVQDNGVTFIFDPYQVAPYSDGQQTVTVPLSVFQAIANPQVFTTATQ